MRGQVAGMHMQRSVENAGKNKERFIMEDKIKQEKILNNVNEE